MATNDVRRVLDIKAQLGESPSWSVEDQALFWVDIHKRTINRFDPAAQSNHTWSLPVMPGSFALRENNGAVIAGQDGMYDIDFANGAVKRLVAAPFDAATHRFNDGKPDRQGRFWAGSLPLKMTVEEKMENASALYRYDGVSLEPGIDPITAANGTAFSPDGCTMYRAESLDGKILALDYDPNTGTASQERVFAEVSPELGILDGATVDTEGGYWIALPYGAKNGGIARFAPSGKLDIYIEMPVVVPTMVAFGGPDMSTIYVTSLSDAFYGDRSDLGEMAGGIFAVQTAFTGIPETRFSYTPEQK